MTYTYKTKGVCSRSISFELEGDIVKNVSFVSGCNGNLQGISSLVEGMSVSQIEERLKGISCNGKGTSCPDQLALAVREAYQKQTASD